MNPEGMPRPLRGRTILLTGASAGIGLATARRLAELGARLLLVCRDATRGERARAAVQLAAGQHGSSPELLLCDLSLLADVHRLCDELLNRYDRLDVLINNAGVLPERLTVTEEGHELCWVTNHLSVFVLTNRLLPLLEAAGPGARVITLASEAHRLGEIEATATARNDPEHSSAFTAYCDSKLANILFTQALADRLELTDITAICLHPGIVRSNLFTRSSWLLRVLTTFMLPFARTTEKAAEAVVELVLSPEIIRGARGRYLKNGRVAQASSRAENRAEANRLWRISGEETGVGE